MTPASSLASELGAPVGEVDGRKLTPMLCALDDTGGRLLTQAGFTFELKLDGVRILADKRGDRVSLSYRTKRDATGSYPEVAAALATLAEERVVLDGEIVAFDAEGRPDFHLLAQRIQATRGRPHFGVVYVVFDVLAVGDRDVRGLPLDARRAILERVLPEDPARKVVRVPPTFDDGPALFAWCREHHLEGVVAKRVKSTYRAGERSADWVKVKHELDADFVVVGWTLGEGRRSRLGALDLASYDDEGRLVARGSVGSGLDEATIDLLLERLAALEVPAPTAPTALGRFTPARERRHVRPEIVVSVRYLTFTPDGSLRHPVFRGVRDDVRPEDCTAGPARPPSLAPARDAAVSEPPARLHLTAPGAAVLPDGTTKGALCMYYERVAPRLLPYLTGRPCALVRADDTPLWPLPRWTPSWVRTTALRTGGPEARGVLVEDEDTLRFAVEAGCVSVLMTPFSEAAPGAADWIAIRTDAAGARVLAELALSIGLSSYPKAARGGAIETLVPLGHAPAEVAQALGALLAGLVSGEVLTSVTAPWAVVVDEGRACIALPLAGSALDTPPPPAPPPLGAPPEADPMAPMRDASPDVAAAIAALEQVVRASPPR